MIARAHHRQTFAFRLASPARLAAFTTLILAGGMGATASAQATPEDRAAVSITAGYQTSQPTFSQSITFEEYSEEGSLTTAYATRRRPVADAGLTLRLWRRLGVGVAGSYFHDAGSATVNALLPNPFVFGQPRPISGPASVTHDELALHLQVAYWATLSPRVALIISGGPTVFRVDQDFVSDVTFSHADPFDTATYEGSSVIRKRQTVTGGNIGGELGWRLARHLALAGSVRYAHANAVFPDTNADAVPVGGLHIGAGLHLLF
ncbi:MAG: hypothetical protein ABI603_10840 [Acidobacteriota bacterium]